MRGRWPAGGARDEKPLQHCTTRQRGATTGEYTTLQGVSRKGQNLAVNDGFSDMHVVLPLLLIEDWLPFI